MSHKFLQFQTPNRRQGIVREVALSTFNSYAKMNLSRTQALKLGRVTVSWDNQIYSQELKKKVPVRVNSKAFSLDDFEQHVESRDFNHEVFNLYELKSDWLDSSVTISPNFHFVDAKGDVLRFRIPTNLGEKFPLVPELDREGHAFSSFQGLLLNRIVSLILRVVDSSDGFSREEWFQDLRSYFSECVSIVDNTLHQLYFKAQYDPLPGWRFDSDKLAGRTGGRLVDKLRWIHRITGNDLNATSQVESFVKLKNLRNHLHHFDPPCFCFTLEEVTDWLNLGREVGVLLWKMREKMNAPLSRPLIKLILLPKIEFVPKSGARRLPMSKSTGYGTTTW